MEHLYVQIRDELKNRILSEELKYGDRVPSEAEICELYDVSRISAKRALNDLEREGYVTRKVGKGTFVSFKPVVHEIGGFYSLADEISRQGDVLNSELVLFEKLRLADCYQFDALGLRKFLLLGEEDEVYHIVCKRFRNSDLIALDNTYIPLRFCPVVRGDEIVGDRAIYEILENRYGRGQISATERYYARSVNDSEAKYLDVSEGSPAMKVMRLTYVQERAMIYNWRVYKGEKIHLLADLGQRQGT